MGTFQTNIAEEANNTNAPLKIEKQIDDAAQLAYNIQAAAWEAIPTSSEANMIFKTSSVPVKNLMLEKRKLKRT